MEKRVRSPRLVHHSWRGVSRFAAHPSNFPDPSHILANIDGHEFKLNINGFVSLLGFMCGKTYRPAVFLWINVLVGMTIASNIDLVLMLTMLFREVFISLVV